MTVDKINLIINLLILFSISLTHSSFFKREKSVKNSFSNIVFDAFFGKEEKLSEEEKRDMEILDMIERYDGKGIRRKEE